MEAKQAKVHRTMFFVLFDCSFRGWSLALSRFCNTCTEQQSLKSLLNSGFLHLHNQERPNSTTARTGSNKIISIVGTNSFTLSILFK